MPQPTILTVSKHEGYYRYGLRRPHPMTRGTVALWDVAIEHDAVVALCRSLSEEVDEANRKDDGNLPAREAFGHKGRGLFDALLPRRLQGLEPLRRELRELSSPLLICSDAPEIYWELLNDGDADGFLGLKCDVGRQLITRGVPGPARQRDHRWRALIVGDPNFDEPRWKLPGAAIEAARLRDWLEARNINCDDCLIGPSATFRTVLEKLLEHSYDIIHYAGHIVPDTDRGSGYAFRLQGGKLFSSNIITNHVRGAPAVFLNGCWSAQTCGEGDPARGVEGLTDAFLGAGAQFVIGSLFQVPDEGACQVAEKFYEFALDRKPVGEALRLARRHVMTQAGCGAAWACYVLYGDPCLCLEVDALEHALRDIGLSRGQFTTPCCEVLGRALEFTGQEGPAGSRHLFAALLDNGEPFLFDGIRRQGVPPESLQKVFRGLYEELPAVYSGSAADPAFSVTAARILASAGAVPGGGGSGSVTSRDVAKAFVRAGGGSMNALLARLGIDVAAIDTGSIAIAVLPPAPAELFIGRLSAAVCAPDAWAVLLHAVDLAFEAGVGFVGTPQLFAALIHDGGALAPRARALGFELPRSSARRKAARSLAGEQVSCSGNVSEILLGAQSFSISEQRDVVTTADILRAFVRQGGGEVGRSFRSEGRMLEVLISELFLDNGELDTARFDEPSQRVIAASLTCIRAKGSSSFTRFHFLHGMLVESGEMSRRLGAQGFQASALAERLYTRIPSELTSLRRAGTGPCGMESELVNMLCMAAGPAGGDRTMRISENDLLAAFLLEGGGAAGEFLIDCGISMAALATLAGNSAAAVEVLRLRVH